MKLISSLLLLGAALFVAGCSDSPTSPTTPGATNSTATSYWPISKGSSWTYTGKLNYTVTVGDDTTFNGKTYTLMHNNTAPTGTYRRDGSSYYSMNLASGQEVMFLKDDPIGGTWSWDLTNQGTSAHYDAILEERGLTHVVLGKTYTDVIRVSLKTYFINPVTGQQVLVNDGNYYYAKGIGLIQSDFGTAGSVDLSSYTIK